MTVLGLPGFPVYILKYVKRAIIRTPATSPIHYFNFDIPRTNISYAKKYVEFRNLQIELTLFESGGGGYNHEQYFLFITFLVNY